MLTFLPRFPPVRRIYKTARRPAPVRVEAVRSCVKGVLREASIPRPMRALVTGGAGFIGSNLVDALVARGDEVTVVDDLSTGRRESLEPALAAGAELVEADVRDAGAMAGLCERVRPEAVFHLAAQIDVRRSTREPAFDAAVNVTGTINMLEAARRTGVRRFVNSSTGGAIYGEGRTLPAPEGHHVAPEAPYGQSKHAAEGYCELYGRLHGLPAVSLRYGNVYGPRQDPHGECGVVAIFSQQMLTGVQPVLFGDGNKTRDYVYVEDIVAANLRALDGAGDGELFNLGWGREVRDIEVFEAIRRALGVAVEPRYSRKRPGEVDRIALDSRKARTQLGWQPRVDFAEGIERSVAYYRRLVADAPAPAARA